MHSCRSRDTKNSYGCSALGLDTVAAGDFTFGSECLASTVLGTERRKRLKIPLPTTLEQKEINETILALVDVDTSENLSSMENGDGLFSSFWFPSDKRE
ncbi:hypothetical protein ACFX1Z_025196 [Malus domestica]